MRSLFIFLFSLLTFCTYAQINPSSQWTWVKGDKTINQLGVYGSKGVASSTNKPGARRGGITWKDNNGNLWLYGGAGYATSATLGNLNDLWKYSPQTDEWTWMHGNNVINAPVSYGEMGVSNSSNTPGGLSNTNYPHWKDNDGNFWVMGLSATMWKYNLQTNEWTWMKGDTVTIGTSAFYGTYGTKGVPDINNDPGSGGTMFWTDTQGKFWMYKTYTYKSSGNGYATEMWKFDPVTNMWAWMDGGNAEFFNQNRSVYGNKGVANDANYPGQRHSNPVFWTDKDGNFYLFGGYGRAWMGPNYSEFYLRDLWKYSPNTLQWTWVNGDSTISTTHFAVYGTQGVPSSSNKPGMRGDASGVVDAFGDLWLIHGWGSSSSEFATMNNDVFKYNISTDQWTWIKGNITGNQFGVYGTQGVASTTNKTGGRWDMSTWMDGNIWIFGGDGYGESGAQGLLNDLWKLSDVYTFIGNGDWNTPTNWLNNNVPSNTITGNMTVVINPQVGGQCTYSGDISIQSGGMLTIKSSTINITGSLTNAGFLNGTGTVNFTGGIPTALNSSGVLTTPITLTNKQLFLTGNTNASASSITLLGSSTIRLENYDLLMGSASLNGVSNQNFIITNGTGSLIRTVSGNPILFPVGTNSTSYTPITINITAGGRKSTDPLSTMVSSGDFEIRVIDGVKSGITDITDGVVKKTWFMEYPPALENSFMVSASWNAADESVSFERENSIISFACPPPRNPCVNSFDIPEDVVGATESNGMFTTSRLLNPIAPEASDGSSFIVRSVPITFTFTGTGSSDWSDPSNWSSGVVPSNTINKGVEIIINNYCTYNGNITIEQGGKLTIKTGNILTVTGSIISQ